MKKSSAPARQLAVGLLLSLSAATSGSCLRPQCEVTADAPACGGMVVDPPEIPIGNPEENDLKISNIDEATLDQLQKDRSNMSVQVVQKGKPFATVLVSIDHDARALHIRFDSKTRMKEMEPGPCHIEIRPKTSPFAVRAPLFFYNKIDFKIDNIALLSLDETTNWIMADSRTVDTPWTGLIGSGLKKNSITNQLQLYFTKTVSMPSKRTYSYTDIYNQLMNSIYPKHPVPFGGSFMFLDGFKATFDYKPDALFNFIVFQDGQIPNDINPNDDVPDFYFRKESQRADTCKTNKCLSLGDSSPKKDEKAVSILGSVNTNHAIVQLKQENMPTGRVLLLHFDSAGKISAEEIDPAGLLLPNESNESLITMGQLSDRQDLSTVFIRTLPNSIESLAWKISPTCDQATCEGGGIRVEEDQELKATITSAMSQGRTQVTSVQAAAFGDVDRDQKLDLVFLLIQKAADGRESQVIAFLRMLESDRLSNVLRPLFSVSDQITEVTSITVGHILNNKMNEIAILGKSRSDLNKRRLFLFTKD